MASLKPAEKTLLLVEDDRALAEGLAFTLQQSGYSVTIAASRAEALAFQRRCVFTVCILDIGLPDGDGFSVCRHIRAAGDTAVLFLSAREEEVHVVRGLELGADDYLVKPFRVGELLARVAAVLRRRSGSHDNGEVIQSGGIVLNLKTGRVRQDGNEVFLTPTEYRLLATLMKQQDAIVPRERLLDALWDSQGRVVEENTLSVNIRRLRQKVEKDPERSRRIETIRGVGYRWIG
ncbi:MAG: response regulator transcription factor [Spirochaeta sp.]|jgi:two-component system response regulator RegX3|nr:response regulator transcription factor [Spirochaeta sp.]